MTTAQSQWKMTKGGFLLYNMGHFKSEACVISKYWTAISTKYHNIVKFLVPVANLKVVDMLAGHAAMVVYSHTMNFSLYFEEK